LRELHERLSDLTNEVATALALDVTETDVESMLVKDLRHSLSLLGLRTSGTKEELQQRLAEAVVNAQSSSVGASGQNDPLEQRTPPNVKRAGAETRSGPLDGIRPEIRLKLEELEREWLEGRGKGPGTGIFTDGSCEPNPGPGGWAAVAVRDGCVVWADHGHDRQTTNNRMELLAIIRALRWLPPTADVTIYSDSNLCVRTLNEWAAGWEKRGWTKPDGAAPKNVEMVMEAWQLSRQRPAVRIEWIKAHDGYTWNEAADKLAAAWNA